MEHLFVTSSDRGKVRQYNEDFAGHVRNNIISGDLFCVADGMGGHGSGDLASKTVVETLLHEFSTLKSIEKNSISGRGGGIHSAYNDNDLTVTHCVFPGDTAEYGIRRSGI